MLEKDDPTPADVPAAIPELLDDDHTKRVRLVAQARELERLRDQVRGTAEREAAAIVTAARSNVRQVLLDARRELLVLVAQLQAVGCDTPAVDASNRIVPSEPPIVTTESLPVDDGSTTIPFDARNEAITDARREVREVLLEAQSELVALSAEARELRARIARRLEPQHEFPLEQPAVAEATPREEQAIDQAMEFAPAEEADAADARPIDTVVESAPAAYAPLASPSRTWIAAAAGIAFAVAGASVVYFAGGAKPSATPSAPVALTTKPKAAPQAASTTTAAAAPTSGVTLSMQVRRPVWIRTTIDGRADSGRVFNVGETRTIRASRDVVLRAGDAGAVLVALSGGKPEPLGVDGQVANRRFGAPVPPPPARPPQLQAAATAARTPGGSPSNGADVGTTGVRDARSRAGAAPANALVSPAATPGSDVEREILRATQRWFEAYFEGDRSQMAEIATADFSLQDQRSDGQRLPPTQSGVERRMQQVRIELAGEGAVMSGRLTERVAADGNVAGC
jgi:hypothetical protein